MTSSPKTRITSYNYIDLSKGNECMRWTYGGLAALLEGRQVNDGNADQQLR